mgnify:CR=1 FL=1
MANMATRGGERAIEQSERLYRAGLGTIDAERVDAVNAHCPGWWTG